MHTEQLKINHYLFLLKSKVKFKRCCSFIMIQLANETVCFYFFFGYFSHSASYEFSLFRKPNKPKKMNFCSDHVYIYNNSEDESITDEEDCDTTGTTNSSVDLSYGLHNCTCSSMKFDSNNNNNSLEKNSLSNMNVSSIVYDDESHQCNCNYCNKKSSMTSSKYFSLAIFNRHLTCKLLTRFLTCFFVQSRYKWGKFFLLQQ